MYYFAYIPWGYTLGKATAVTVKVPSELKEKMKRVRVNWSEYIREAIQKKIEEQRLQAASAKIDEVRTRAKPVPTDELVSWIREDRER
jgi:post-segregation antitoxin (ccd killing protein)